MDELTVLALRAKAGDRRALEDLFAEVRPDVLKLCGYLGRPADPNDLCQEALERAFGSLHRFRAEGSARGWFLSIARRTCVDATRRMGRQRNLRSKLIASQTTDLSHDPLGWKAVDDALDQLDDDRREAFVLTQFLGLTYPEAADAVGCPVGTIRSRVARARSDLLRIEALSERSA